MLCGILGGKKGFECHFLSVSAVQVKTTESTVVPADAEGATVNTAVHDATEHSTTLNNATDAALIRAPFNATGKKSTYSAN